MTDLLALPMYDIDRPTTAALSQALVTLLAQHGTAAQPVWPDDLLAHWQDDRLLLSQTCGYPLMTRLPAVQLVGAFHYTAPGCSGPDYRSWLVARDKGATLGDFHAHRVAVNSVDSHSGYNALRYVAAQQGVTFSQRLLSGGHRQSLAMVRQHQADIAAIDCISWALIARSAPEELQGLHIIGETPPAPGLPLITSAATSRQQLATLQRVLAELVSTAAWRERCAASLIGGFSPLQRQDYQPLIRWEQQAAARGVTRL